MIMMTMIRITTKIIIKYSSYYYNVNTALSEEDMHHIEELCDKRLPYIQD